MLNAAPAITLRAATPADWGAIATLLQTNRLPLDGAQQHLANYVLACRGENIVGVAGAEVYADLALLRSFAVLPAMHRQGVGRLLLEHLLAQAHRRQIATAYLLTTTAPDYFARFGFQHAARELAPAALHASAEFQGACPASAALMALTLRHDHATARPDIAQQLP
jgi:N-acetylglutamate synthase-like GNAT family acetyltransferase